MQFLSHNTVHTRTLTSTTVTTYTYPPNALTCTYAAGAGRTGLPEVIIATSGGASTR